MDSKGFNTPLMRQYKSVKAKHPDAILLFRVGDFYETFSTDAVKTSEILGIALAKRAGIELAGFPYHALDTYLPKLVRAGQRVAVCEQLEDPKLTKKIVKRGITELITPGVALNDNILEHRENNFLASVHFAKNEMCGIAFADISTGEFFCAEGNIEYVDKILNNFNPKEVLFEREKQKIFEEYFGNKFYKYPVEDWMFVYENSKSRLLKQFDTHSLKGFGIDSLPNGITAAGAILHYIDLTQHNKIRHFTKIMKIQEERYVWLDKFTIRNLEIFHPIHENGKTLVEILDKTKTSMGSRLLKRWLSFPLKQLKPIEDRLNAVEFLTKNLDTKVEIQNFLKSVGDLERLTSKIATQRINPRELLQLKNTLDAIEPIKKLCSTAEQEWLKKISTQLDGCELIKNRIAKEIREDAPSLLVKGNVIAQGVSQELDELRYISTSSKDYLKQLEQRLSRTTGISSLKIGNTNVFGYYFEVRNTYKNRVPADWVRKQTLVGAERYVNEELKQYEEKILSAEEKIALLEEKCFADLVLTLADYISVLQVNASLLAQLDCLLSFSEVAVANKYCKPNINESQVIDIKQGRHPVIEKQLPFGEEYIANDIFLNPEDEQILIITGPNMSGKSALLRQVALIVFMSQMGSFVPAESANIGFVDKIFTRVGASDNISLGESTFMVEMTEAASILNNLSERSLVLFDELGRGTSTYDGISIAWAIVEYIHNHPNFSPKTLFATHYHELNEMIKTFSRVKNFHVSVKEVETPDEHNKGRIIFLRKLVEGGSEHSFGIHVARMAGMPLEVINRANEILSELEQVNEKRISTSTIEIAPKDELNLPSGNYQLSFFDIEDPLLKKFRDELNLIDVNNITAMQAFAKISEWKKLFEK